MDPIKNTNQKNPVKISGIPLLLNPYNAVALNFQDAKILNKMGNEEKINYLPKQLKENNYSVLTGIALLNLDFIFTWKNNRFGVSLAEDRVNIDQSSRILNFPYIQKTLMKHLLKLGISKEATDVMINGIIKIIPAICGYNNIAMHFGILCDNKSNEKSNELYICLENNSGNLFKIEEIQNIMQNYALQFYDLCQLKEPITVYWPMEMKIFPCNLGENKIVQLTDGIVDIVQNTDNQDSEYKITGYEVRLYPNYNLNSQELIEPSKLLQEFSNKIRELELAYIQKLKNSQLYQLSPTEFCKCLIKLQDILPLLSSDKWDFTQIDILTEYLKKNLEENSNCTEFRFDIRNLSFGFLIVIRK